MTDELDDDDVDDDDQDYFDVVGESHYQDALAKLVGGRQRDAADFACLAKLVPDAHNRHDANAVRVEIGGKLVGHLDREDAIVYRKLYGTRHIESPAAIVGGWDRGPGNQGLFGVQLALKMAAPAGAVKTPLQVKVQHRPGCLLQLIFFVFVGWWLGGLAAALAYLLFIPVVTIPIGVKIINRMPYLIALREPALLATPWGAQPVKQHNMLLRVVWFVLFGFWLAALWMSVAYVLCLTIIGMPAGFWMFDQTPAMLTLRRSA